MKRPSSVKIGAYDITIEYIQGLDVESNLHGDFNYRKMKIRINGDDHPQVQYVTLWHELLHAIYWERSLTPTEEEDTVDRLSTGLAMVFKDNPVLAKYLCH